MAAAFKNLKGKLQDAGSKAKDYSVTSMENRMCLGTRWPLKIRTRLTAFQGAAGSNGKQSASQPHTYELERTEA